MQSIATKNRANGARAWPDLARRESDKATHFPLRPGMTAEPVTGVVALVLAAPDYIGERGRGVDFRHGLGHGGKLPR